MERRFCGSTKCQPERFQPATESRTGGSILDCRSERRFIMGTYPQGVYGASVRLRLDRGYVAGLPYRGARQTQ
jgi:hypothetical protein